MQGNFDSSVESALEIAVGYLDAAVRCLAKTSQMVADFTTFTGAHVRVAGDLSRLQEEVSLVLQELEQVQDDFTETEQKGGEFHDDRR